MYIDSSKSGIENLFALINVANETDLVPNPGLIVGTPEVFAGPDNHNTRINLSADPEGAYSDDQDFYYTRLGLDKSVASPPTQYPIDRNTTPAQFLDQVVAALNLVKEEVEPIASITRNVPNLTLTPIANSLLYVGTLQLALEWPVGQPYTFLLDNFTGDGPLSAHTSDDGTHWWGNFGDPASAVAGDIVGGVLVSGSNGTYAYPDKTVPSEHITTLKFNIDSVPTYASLELSAGSSRYRYNLYLEVKDDGKLYWQLARKDVANQSQLGNFTFVLGPQVAEIMVSHDVTELRINGELLATMNTQRYVDSNIVYFELENGDDQTAIKIDSIEVTSIGAMEEAPLDLWYAATRGSNYRGQNSQIVIGEKLWSCNGSYLQCFSCETGQLVSEFDINALAGITNQLYALACTDVKNGYIWLENRSGFTANVPSIIRFDPAGNDGLGAYKDALFASTGATTAYVHLTQGASADGVWAYQSGPGGRRIVNLHPDTGAVVSSTDVAILSTGITGMAYDSYSSRLMFSEVSGTTTRIRFFNTGPKTVQPTVYTGRGSIGNGDSYAGLGGFYHVNYNDATDNYRLSKFNLADQTVLDVDIVSAELPPGDGDVWVHGPVHEFRDLNEIMVVVERYDPDLDVYPQELWAFDSDTLAFRRKVSPYAPSRRVYDYCLDAGGNLYMEILLDGAPRTSKLLRSYRT